MTDFIEHKTTEVVLVVENTLSTIEIANEATLVVENEKLILISEATQGPPGINGTNGKDGYVYTGAEIPDLTLIFDNRLV